MAVGYQHDVILLGDPASWHIKELTRAFTGRSWEVRVADAKNRAEWEAVQHRATLPRLLWIRQLSSGNTEQTIFRMDLLYHWAIRGTAVINSPRALERTVDKYFTQILLERAGIPVPQTLVTEDRDLALATVADWGQAVLKPLFGSQGKGLMLLDSPEMAWRVLNTLNKVGTVFYLQKFIPYQADVRILIAFDQVVAAMQRESMDWRANVALGGRPRHFPVPDVVAAMAIKAARQLECTYAGVDCLLAEDGRWYVLEINGIAGWQGLQTVTPFNIASRLVEMAHHALG